MSSIPPEITKVESKVVAWIKAQMHWVHLLNTAGIIASILKLFGKI